MGTETGQAYHTEHGRVLRSRSDSVDRDQFAAAWAVGPRITVDERVADALSVVGKTIVEIPILAAG